MLKFIATCAAGLETLVGDELRSWGVRDLQKKPGALGWSGTLESGYRGCLWSRFASRILLVIGEFKIADTDQLYERASTICWEEHLSVTDSFAVDCSLAAGAVLTHSKFASLRIKDSIVDRFRRLAGKRPQVQVKRPDVLLHLRVDGDQAVLAVDLSGESLHRRGYRVGVGEAPLKESLAAAIVVLSGWRGSETLIDPMCGSATLLIEAALYHGDSAPGLGRSYYGLTGWQGHDAALWSALVSEALEREEAGVKKEWPPLIGYDADRKAVAAARANIIEAGLDGRITVEQKQLYDLGSVEPEKKGWLITNPPYGQRLSEAEQVRYLYRCLGRKLSEHFGGWQAGIFTSNPDYADLVRLNRHKAYKLNNGPISCRLFIGSIDQREPPFAWNINLAPTTATEHGFANRIRKNIKKLLPWFERRGIRCFRLYDRDLPDYNVRVEAFGKYLFVEEFRAPSAVDPDTARTRFSHVLHELKSVMGVGRDRVYLKRRTTGQPPAARNKKRKLLEAPEGSGNFLVDLSGSSTTGLALDQRAIRERLFEESAGLRFLSLFDQTGTSAVQAALGGARHTTTIVETAGLANWSRENFSLNGLYFKDHSVEVEDPLPWLEKNRDKFDLIYMNPRAGHSSRKKQSGFDLQRDHARLISSAMRRLKLTGLLIFSTRYHSFSFDRNLGSTFQCSDISNKMVPRDCTRSEGRHQTWEIRHRST